MLTNPADNLRREAIAAQARGDVAHAEDLYRACLAIQPDDLDSQSALCAILAHAKRFDDAIALLKAAANTRPRLTTLLSLVDFYLAADRLESADNLLKQIHASVPDCGPALLQSAQLASRRRQIDRALALFRQALDVMPGHVVAALAYARAATESAPQDALVVLEKLLARDDLTWQDRARLLRERAQVAERLGRRAQGLPQWAVDAADLEMRFSQAELEAFRDAAAAWRDLAPESPDAITAQVLAALALGRDIEARAAGIVLEGLDPKSLVRIVARGPAFCAEIDQPGDVAAPLPPIAHVKPATFSDGPIYFLSCDYGYWINFAGALVRSIVAAGPHAQIHLHVIDASPDQLSAITAFALTLEGAAFAITTEVSPFQGTPRAPEYYQAVRFVRFHQLLEHYRRPLCVMDVDGLMNRDVRTEIASRADCDIALRVQPGALEPWQRFYAGMVVVWPTEAGRRYARLVAAFIVHFYREGYLPSGIDQFALSAVYRYLGTTGQAVRLEPFSGAVIDDLSDPASCLWLQTGRRKWLKKTGAHDDGDDSRYAQAFRRFSD